MVANAAPAPAGGYDALAVVQESFVETGNLRLEVTGDQISAIEAVVL